LREGRDLDVGVGRPQKGSNNLLSVEMDVQAKLDLDWEFFVNVIWYVLGTYLTYMCLCNLHVLDAAKSVL